MHWLMNKEIYAGNAQDKERFSGALVSYAKRR